DAGPHDHSCRIRAASREVCLPSSRRFDLPLGVISAFFAAGSDFSNAAVGSGDAQESSLYAANSIQFSRLRARFTSSSLNREARIGCSIWAVGSSLRSYWWGREA